VGVVADADNVSADQGSLASETTPIAVSYYQRARELVAKAHTAPDRTPDAAERFARFLLTCPNESFRDPPRALELSKGVVEVVPERSGPWFILALAHYRNGNLQAADEAIQSSMKRSSSDEGNVCNRILLSMVRWKQGRTDEARQTYEMALQLAGDDKNEHDSLLTFITEAAVLIHFDDTEKQIGISSD
jgi:Flp pilus assembly protein TadD